MNSPLQFLHLHLYLSLIEGLSVIIAIAFILVQTPIARFLFNFERSFKKQILLGVFFGLVSIAGTYLGEPIGGAIANIRDIGAITGGLFGGPVVGLVAGLIGGLHRYTLGGFTALPCALATITNGLVAGLIYRKREEDIFNPFRAMLFAVAAESFHMLLVLTLAKPYTRAVTLINVISGPMIISNAIGVWMFLFVVKASYREREFITALTAEKVLKIAEKTLPILSKGLNEETAKNTAEIILKNTNLDAVGITDRERILAFSGAGEDHHKSGDLFHTKATKDTIKEGRTIVMYTPDDIGCNVKNCPLSSGVVVPMRSADGEIFGVLKLYRTRPYAISLLDMQIAKGLADILSTQIQLNRIEKEKKLRMVSQIRALQARINPHFLFNALNTVRYMVRKDPDRGYDLLLKLSFILRETLERKANFVTVREEIDLIKAYLSIEKVRFGERLETHFDVEDAVQEIKIPTLLIQPIVENAIKHGFSPDTKKLIVEVKVYKRLNMLYMVVSDNGRGISKDKLDEILSYESKGSIGIRNVSERLKNLYGDKFYFKITSKPQKGTKVIIGIPMEGVKEWLLGQLSLTTKSQREKK
jgi:LytS/YehU family sensor histidine kinase